MLEAFPLLPRDMKLLPLNESGSSSAPELCPVSGCGSTSRAAHDHLWHSGYFWAGAATGNVLNKANQV